jgi:hypothetical protein
MLRIQTIIRHTRTSETITITPISLLISKKMSLGGNLSSGYTSQIIDTASRQCSLPPPSHSDTCCAKTIPGPQPVAVRSSIHLAKKTVCPKPSRADFALFPKVAGPSSVRTQAIQGAVEGCRLVSPNQRFSRYDRYTPPVPCPPLPAFVNMVGISQPSTRACNL